MNMKENSRFIKGLRLLGWTDKQINDFALYIEDGDETFISNTGSEAYNKEEDNK